ncbi:hypothetical protein BAUCODRAFT_148591 [Baudoinia panamericana UAMH 10762]|uniref:Peroxidase n=1 Tax=Baudoinia panamericana (strain UAMH 10762) TaxID=717646 RepID=M2LMZ2_BAUPA|nr:uncharacterized protein BAUCODRAFT_148591 [Baudoinia panamericana UAMH 10762]EMC95707.1 hypothetical protein BAUCODRAFT_148591 [Baudoinia panamericana UAMH 10762]
MSHLTAATVVLSALLFAPSNASPALHARDWHSQSIAPFGFSSSTTASIPASSSTSTSSGCPAVWSTVATDLKSAFTGCNVLARNAIRFAFHDAAGYSSKTPYYAPATGGADGSLLLSSDEIKRQIEAPLQRYQPWLLGKYNKYHSQGVGAADLVQFAGNIGIRSCNGGPIVRTLVGRQDTSTAAPEGMLPEAFGQGSDYDTLVQLFLDKGFSATDLAALIGAHTVSQAFAEQGNGIPPGGPQDSTPTQWDTTYYKELQSDPRGVYHFQSDVNLGNQTTAVGMQMARFAQDEEAFDAAFADAMGRMNLLGISEEVSSGFADCTSLVQ